LFNTKLLTMMLGREIARFECKANPLPLQPERVPLSFGARSIPALVERLDADTQKSSVVIIALEKLDELLRLPREAAAALRTTDTVERLTKLASHQDIVIRIQALSCLAHLAGTFEGKDHIREHKTLSALVPHFHAVKERRFKSMIFELLTRVANSSRGAQTVVESGFVAALAQQLRRGMECSSDSLSSAASVLCQCATNCPDGKGLQAIFDQHIVGVVVPLLKHDKAKVRVQVARFLESITFHSEGRTQALGQETSTVKTLCDGLSDKDTDVRARAAGVLANVCTGSIEKKLAMDEGGLDRLLGIIVTSKDEGELICALRCVTVLVALPEMRSQCRSDATAMGAVAQLTVDPESVLLCETAKITQREINWSP
jgi:hypothetical protein